MLRLKELEEKMPAVPDCMLAGVSGGADSVALLHMLLLRGCQVHVVHVNHGLRGDASDGDEAFVRALCAENNVPLTVFRLKPPVHPGEDWARRERYRCFREAMAATGISTLALAHHRDDQAETLLLHLLRGSGLTGLTGMAADSVSNGLRLIRPLLGFSRQELREALAEDGQFWREDESNRDSRYLRNALRHQLLPLAEQLAPGSTGRLAATAEILQADEDALQSLTEAFLQRHQQGCCMPVSALGEQPPGLQKRILRSWWQNVGGDRRDERSLSREQTEAFCALVSGRTGMKCNLPGGWHGYRGWTHLHLISPEKPETAGVQLVGTLPEGCVVRTRQTGDWLQLPGGKRSLQDFLTDRKIDAPFRDRIPLVCRGNQVMAAAGVWNGKESLGWAGNMPWAAQQCK